LVLVGLEDPGLGVFVNGGRLLAFHRNGGPLGETP
jgi:hypothetical protein